MNTTAAEAFIYLWYDSENKMFYLGKHRGSPDDGYTHSSTIWESFTKNNVPRGVSRRILAYGTHEEICILEHELLINRKKRCWDRYYNKSLGDPRYFDTSGKNNPRYKHGLATGEKLVEYRKQYGKQYRKDNKENIAEYSKQYSKNNKEKIAEWRKQYNKNNREKLVEYRKQYYEDNKEKIIESSKQYYVDNVEYRKQYGKQYYEDNREKIIENNQRYRKKQKDL